MALQGAENQQHEPADHDEMRHGDMADAIRLLIPIL